MSIDDFADSSGHVDWVAYHKNEVRIGRECQKCGEYIISLFERVERPRDCGSCMRLDNCKEEVRHDTMLRCPKCGNQQDANDEWENGIYDDNNVSHIMCHECEYEYEATTHILYSYESPPMIES